jgi:hypothetical protein
MGFRLAPLILVCLAACKDPLGFYSVDVFTTGYVPPRGGSPVPVAFVADQVVTFVARETFYHSCDGGCTDYVTSDQSPSSFVWESDNPAVAKVLSRGQVQMLSVGAAKLRVSTEYDSRTVIIRVVPPISSMSVGPKTIDLATNRIAWTKVIAYDAVGGRIPGVGVSEGTAVLTPEDKPENFVDPVAAYTAAAGDSIAVYGLRPGTIRFIASLPVFGAHTLRDTVTVIVK